MEKENFSGTDKLLGEKPVFGLLMKMAVPTMISMFIQSMYNIVDSIFVTRINDNALNAVSLVYPLQNLVLALSVGIGVGLNSCISRALGAKDGKLANSFAMHGVLITLVNAVLFILIGLFATEPFLKLFTDDEQVLAYGVSYGKIVLCFAFFSLIYIGVEKLLQATGNTFFPMIMQGVGAVINIVLDPLLIFGIWIFPEMGVAGAAVATIIGQGVSCLLAVIYFAFRNGGIKLSFRGYRIRGGELGAIFAVGIPSSLMIAMPSVLISIMNAILITVSETAVNFYGIYYKLQTLIYVPASGLVQGMRPIVGYNQGAKKYSRMNATVWWSVLVVGSIIFIGSLVFLFFPAQILALFKANDEMLKIGVPALRIIASGFLISTLGVILSGAFEALGMGVRSLLVTLVRQFVLIPPIAYLLIPAIGLTGAWIAYPVSEVAASALACAFYFAYLRKIKRQNNIPKHARFSEFGY